MPGYYEITTSPGDACFCVYLPSTSTTYPPGKAIWDVGCAARKDTKPAIKKFLKQRRIKVDVTDLFAVIRGPVDACLNATGFPHEGAASSPEKRYIYKEMLSLLQPIPWSEKCPQT